ncbi:hypothetical protein QBE54_09730 [Thermatribacter velox]|uniref:HepT-like domain-containing protein n=1 Tax=Thermatribacter velox TaxID=3039681 RepID=A0ABZ2YC32_9BACT
MEEGKFAILKSELMNQWNEIVKIYKRIEERKRKRGIHALESLAYQLHNLYCAYEDLFKIVAGFFENNIEEPSTYHTELPKRMKMEIEGVRPALISEESFKLLNSLRGFRHFFRHAYSYELDERKVSLVLEDALKLKETFKPELENFLSKLQ